MLARMFKSVLIPRGGEAASRVARTCRQLGLESVVISANGTSSRHVEAADRVLELEGGEPAVSPDALGYLIEASKADAIHLGYEGQTQVAELARAAEQSDVAVVGADADALASLHDRATLQEAAERAALRVIDPSERPSRARVIGVLVATDSHGSTVSFAECDRSLQASERTLIHEAPATELVFRADGEAFRTSLFESARRLVAELRYPGLFEVRFYVDAGGRAHIHQVRVGLCREHALVEMVTGVDLVALQLRIAAGEPLPDELSILEPRGHAITASIVALERATEPASRLAFAPAPQGRVRWEASATVGSTLPADDLPLIAKVTTHEPIRHRALLTLDRMLAEIQVAPFETNTDALRGVLADYAFRAGQYDSERF